MTQTAKTYAGALYDLAKEEALVEVVKNDLELVASLMRENPDYLRLLSTPSVPKPERRKLLDEALRESIHLYTLNFLKILCDHGTISQLYDCKKHYRERYNEEHGILSVCAVSAVELSPSLREKLLKKLTGITGKEIDLQVRVEESLLGGIRLELPDRQLDGSVAHHLQQLQKNLRQTVL